MTLLNNSAEQTTLRKPFLKQKRTIVITVILLTGLTFIAIMWPAVSPMFTNVTVGEPFPFETGVANAKGQFTGTGFIHRGSGNATIYEEGDQRVLRLEDFHVTNGPDLQVLLVENMDGGNSEAFGSYLNLGSLKGNIGNQNYAIPADVDLSQYSGVIIYCEPFHVVFSTAAFSN